MVLILRGLAFVLAIALLAGCSKTADPQMRFATAVDTVRTHQEKLEAVSRFIENTVLLHYNAVHGEHPHSNWTRHVPEAMDRVIDDLEKAGFRPTDAGRAYRIQPTVYVNEQELLTTWIETRVNKARIVVAGCHESPSRQLIGRQLALSTKDRMEDGPIHVVHRSHVERTLPDDWVTCTASEDR